jgi:hypothetical protein
MNVPKRIVLKDIPFKNEKLMREINERRNIIIREIAERKIIEESKASSKA